jgi:tetratricopeptide (TPR) repeat protein
MTPDALIAELRGAVKTNDGATFERLCNEHYADILEHLGSWLTVPEAIRSDAAAVERFVRVLSVLAESFQAAGYPQLMDKLTGSSDNPIPRWRNTRAAAQQRIAEGRFSQAIAILKELLHELDEASGSRVDDLRPKAYALLGQAHVGCGNFELGRHFTQLALDECRRLGDQEGVRIYTGQLRVIAGVAAGESSSDENEPSSVVRANIARAQRVSDEAEFADSNEILLKLLADKDRTEAVEEYRGKIHGLLGLNFSRLGDRDQARSHTEQALEHCKRSDDAEGVRIYSANLEAIGKQ